MSATLAVLLLVAAPETPAAPPAGPKAMLEARTADVKAMMGQPADEARKTALRTLVAGFVDYDELARSSLGKHWDGRAEAERTEFRDLLRSLIEKSYLEQVERRPEFQVRWDGERLSKDGGKAKVATTATAEGSTVEVEYRLMKRDAGWIVVDVVIDGVSMVRNYRRSFSKVVTKDGWPALIDKMTKKLAE